MLRELPEATLRKLVHIAEHHGGTIAIHGRLFAQWLHLVHFTFYENTLQGQTFSFFIKWKKTRPIRSFNPCLGGRKALQFMHNFILHHLQCFTTSLTWVK